MILAAGRGERLRPLTDRTPKALIEVGDQTLIERHLAALAAAGVHEIVINLAWQGDRIERHLGSGEAFGLDIHYSREPEGALETAGGVRHALPLLGQAPFILISADALTDFPLASLLTRTPAAVGHLVLVDNPPHHAQGDFGLKDGHLTRNSPRFTYSGIGVFRPSAFQALEPGPRALRSVFETAIDARQLSGEYYSGRWLDVGTPQRLERARALIADSHGERSFDRRTGA